MLDPKFDPALTAEFLAPAQELVTQINACAAAVQGAEATDAVLTALESSYQAFERLGDLMNRAMDALVAEAAAGGERVPRLRAVLWDLIRLSYEAGYVARAADLRYAAMTGQILPPSD